MSILPTGVVLLCVDTWPASACRRTRLYTGKAARRAFSLLCLLFSILVPYEVKSGAVAESAEREASRARDREVGSRSSRTNDFNKLILVAY